MSTVDTAAPNADTGWFVHDRFGMFVHFGLYSIAARHEWVMTREKISASDYRRYFEHFDPDLFDAAELVDLAVRGGMRYVVLTTKHHEGFCLWDSKVTDYTSVNAPCGRDLVREFVDAARAAGLRVGLYYSLIDWHHEQFPIDGIHPLRDEPAEKVRAINEERRIRLYADYLHAQVRELLTSYGTIDYLFFDYSYAEGAIPPVWGGKGAAEWQSEQLLTMVRGLQPGIVVNDRLGIPGDVTTPEQYQPTSPMEKDGQLVTWEACQTMNGSWGYDRDNHDMKSPELVARMLIDTVAMNGNMLLNVGPDGRGRVDPESGRVIDTVGSWVGVHSRAVYGAGPASWAAPTDVRYTQRGRRLYVHLFAWPFGALHLPDLADQATYAQFLHDASEVRMVIRPPEAEAFNTVPGGQPAGTLTLELPVQRPDVLVPVIEIFLS
ncbi:alpha-L-fucosidase [Microbacterium sp. 22303]|uniref:alpha-L-fucosidase n=1 Tax=Microbacterium sp. 22303 TaxID=3453905 RepID=UPI003F831169